MTYISRIWALTAAAIVTILLGTVSTVSFSSSIALLISAIGSVICVGMALLTTHRFKREARQMMAVVDMLQREEDLSVRALTTGNTEWAIVAKGVNRFLDSLTTSLSSARKNTESLFESSAQISASSSQMACSIDEQTVQTSAVSQTIEQLSVRVAQIAENAVAAQSDSSKVYGLATQGESSIKDAEYSVSLVEEHFNRALEMIVNLESQSQEIDSIINVVEGIAEQTNLLALNAAIEAARAGEQGRGFAVVADEVRNLAARTQDATVEVIDKIGSIRKSASKTVENMERGQDQINRGVGLTKKVVDILGEITESASFLDKLASEIAEATDEQNDAVQNVRESVGGIESIATENTQSIHHANDNIRSLLGQAVKLNAELDAFSCVERTPLNKMHKCITQIRMNAVLAASSSRPEETREPIDNIQKIDGEIDKLWDNYLLSVQSEQERAQADQFYDKWQTFLKARKLTLDYSAMGDFTAARENAAKNAGPKFKLALQDLLALIRT